MLLPLSTSVIFQEWRVVVDFGLSMCATLSVGYLLLILFHTDKDPQWVHGMAAVAIAWILCTLLGALPHYLSGHFGSFLDACFDVMSGHTTTGLVLIQDLDHVSHGLNMWRHELTYVGGQGIVVVALTFLIPGVSGAYRLYVGEGKEERILPNVVKTARMIWIISLIYLAVGSAVLWIGCMWEGLSPLRALLHGIWLFMANWSTGGFAPQSQNLIYYHSPLIEFFLVALMVLGSLNFALHYTVWNGNYKELYRNIEIHSFAVTLTVSFVLCCVGLIQVGIFPELPILFRRAFLHVVSAHTGTGSASVYSRQFITDWGAPAALGVILAMAIGGSACSTAGGFKGIRMGILAKALWQDIKRLVSPESAIVVQKFHHIKDRVLDNAHVRSAALIVLLYVLTYAIGTAAGVFCGYPVLDALFDSVSAGANVGLSSGVTSPAMPAALKVVYIIEMWAGRLEFTAILVLLGMGYATITGK